MFQGEIYGFSTSCPGNNPLVSVTDAEEEGGNDIDHINEASLVSIHGKELSGAPEYRLRIPEKNLGTHIIGERASHAHITELKPCSSLLVLFPLRVFDGALRRRRASFSGFAGRAPYALCRARLLHKFSTGRLSKGAVHGTQGRQFREKR